MNWKPIEALDKTKMQFLLVCEAEQETMRLFLWNPAGYWEHPHPMPGQRVGDHDVCSEPSHWMELPPLPKDA